MDQAGRSGLRTGALAAWIALSLLGGSVAALRHDDPIEVAATGPPSERGGGWSDTDEPRLPQPTTTSSTTPPPPPSTAPPAASPAPPPQAPSSVLTIDRPGIWIIRADGSAARHLGTVGQDGYSGYPAHWTPDSSALLGLQSRDGEHLELVRTALDGSRQWYGLPPSPAISDDIGPAPRWITEFEVAGTRISFGWRRADGFAGAAVGTLDLSRVLVEFEDDFYCCRGVGNADGSRFAFATGSGIEVLDLQGRRVAGPFDLGAAGGDVNRGVGRWSSDGRHLLAAVQETACILDVATGGCRRLAEPASGWMGGGRELLIARHGLGATPQSLYVGAPGATPRLLTSNGSYGVSSPDGSAVVFGRSPYEDGLAGRASVHIVGADGKGERVLALTRNAIAFPASWSPDGQWIAVHLGGPA